MMGPYRIAFVPLALFLHACSGSSAQTTAPRNHIATDGPKPPLTLVTPAPSQRVLLDELPAPEVTNAFTAPVYDPNTRNAPRSEKDLCEIANRNIQSALDAVLEQPRPVGQTVARSPWSGKKPAQYLDLVEGRYAFTAQERNLLQQNGLVVPERLSRGSYAHAYHDIFQSQLPVYVTMDSLFHAVFKAHESLMVHVERDLLMPRLRRLLIELRRTFASTTTPLPPEIHRDLDLYLTVAISLLVGKTQSALSAEVHPDVESTLERIKDAQGLFPVDLLGRTRMVDFSQYQPRGYYALYDELVPYFKAFLWLSRLEFNLVSRSSRSSAPGIAPDPRETPREAMSAVALARLVDEAKMTSTLAEIEQTLQSLGGNREDIGVTTLLGLYRKTGGGKLDDPASFEALKREIGSGFVRTARLHYMPQGSTELPVIFSLLGPRVTPDTAAQRLLVHGETPNRFDLHAADMAYVLGHDRARDFLQSDSSKFPGLEKQWSTARKKLDDIQSTDLYSSWLLAIRELSRPPPAKAPTFMHGKPFRDLRINSTVAAYGQLRRNNVAIAGQTYDEGGCEIPDGYVEPAPEVLDRLIAFTQRATALLETLGEKAPAEPSLNMGLATLFPRMTRMFKALRRIVDREVAGEALTEPEKRLLATVAEIVPGTSGSPPLYTGWYFHLFETRWHALANPSFIGDYYTSTNTGQVAYAGAGDPALGIFVVDVGGTARLMVGPVARAYELHAPLSHRLTDEEGRLQGNKVAAWASSYLVDKPVAPTLHLFEDEAKSSDSVKEYLVKTQQKIRTLKVEFLSHHGQPCGTGQTTLETLRGSVRVKLKKTPADDPCNGGYRLTVDGQPFVVETNYWPYEMGLGDMWNILQQDEE